MKQFLFIILAVFAPRTNLLKKHPMLWIKSYILCFNQYYFITPSIPFPHASPRLFLTKLHIDTKSMYIDNIIFSDYNLYIPNEC